MLSLGVCSTFIAVLVSRRQRRSTIEHSRLVSVDEIVEAASIAYWEVDARTTEFASVGGRVEEVFNTSLDELPSSLVELVHEDDRALFWGRILGAEDDQFVIECRLATVEPRWLRCNVRRTTIGHQQLLRGVSADATDVLEAQGELRRRADSDHLTGLANRTVLVAHITERCLVGDNFAVFVADFDRFKEINDTLGHDSGDEFLREMANRLRAVAPKRSLVSRLGGDEFAIAAGGLGGVNGVQKLAEDLARACQSTVDLDGVEIEASASIGVAMSPHHGTTSAELLANADMAMYRAKRSDAGTAIFDVESDSVDREKLRLGAEVERSLALGELRLWFQPKVDLGTQRTVGAEGLLRWNHPVHGEMSPAQFLDIVELSRYRKALCRSVVDQGVSFVADAARQGHDLSVSVNITFRDLVDPELPRIVSECLARHDVRPESLTLEITERDLMDDRIGFQQAAIAVRELGIGLSIDDFGTGQSSLLRVRMLPVTELKIDRSFVNDLGNKDLGNNDADIIVRSIVELGRSLRLRLVAEGVETPRQLAQLRALRCDQAQGYLFSPAVPREELLASLNAQTYAQV